jgi:hypothetical protein
VELLSTLSILEWVRAMPLFRIETVEDKTSGRYAIEIYFPADAEQPYVTTAARYMTSAAAENDILATIAAAANNPVSQSLKPR